MLRRIDASTIGFSTAGGAEVTVTLNVPTAAVEPFVQIKNAKAASKTIDVDYFERRIGGLSRT
jgi:hypothetical protein